MNDLQILTKAIQKAQKKGYVYQLDYDDENGKHYVKMLDLHRYFAIIFDHRFAQPFFGRNWRSNLQEMALCKKPLEYLEYYLGE